MARARAVIHRRADAIHDAAVRDGIVSHPDFLLLVDGFDELWVIGDHGSLDASAVWF